MEILGRHFLQVNKQAKFFKIIHRTMVSAQNETGPVYQRIQVALTEKFGPTHLDVQDDSHKHAGHAAMKHNEHHETHFTVTVVSEKFDKVSVIERHRLVNDALEQEMDTNQGGTIHALSIKAKTPEQWAKLQNRQ